jgi:hypothetical protein
MITCPCCGEKDLEENMRRCDYCGKLVCENCAGDDGHDEYICDDCRDNGATKDEEALLRRDFYQSRGVC